MRSDSFSSQQAEIFLSLGLPKKSVHNILTIQIYNILFFSFISFYLLCTRRADF